MARPAAMGKFRAEGQPKGSPGHSPAHTRRAKYSFSVKN